MWKCFRNTRVLLHVRANGVSPVSAMTHMLWLRGQSVHTGTDDTRSVVSPLVSVGCKPGDMYS